MKTNTTGLALAVLLALTAVGCHSGKSTAAYLSDVRIATPENGLIGHREAFEKAYRHAGLESGEATWMHCTMEDFKGTEAYHLTFNTSFHTYQYWIGAKSGEVMEHDSSWHW